MKLTWLAVETQTPVVIDAVGDVRGLLDFCDEAASADGVDTSCREEEYIAGLYFEIGEDIRDSVVLHSLYILFRSDFLREA